MTCKHKHLSPTVHVPLEIALRGHGGSIVIDVWCEECGLSGTAIVQPGDVDWGEGPGTRSGGAVEVLSGTPRSGVTIHDRAIAERFLDALGATHHRREELAGIIRDIRQVCGVRDREETET
jgi:hypothetical protein